MFKNNILIVLLLALCLAAVQAQNQQVPDLDNFKNWLNELSKVIPPRSGVGAKNTLKKLSRR